MNHIHLDAVGGIAGDMFIAAMLDMIPHLRPSIDQDIHRILPADIGRVEIAKTRKNGMHAQTFNLVFNPDYDAHGKSDHGHDHGHEHEHRIGSGAYTDIIGYIRSSNLAPGTITVACAILTLLAEAEAKTHAVDINDVHFHEIADWDSVLDVVIAGSIIAALPDTRWSVSDLPRGGGLVKTQHGLLPVPAPATAELLAGFTWRDDGISGERVTPTGAAILKYLIDPENTDVALPRSARLLASGVGAGTRNITEMPNILRALQFGAVSVARDVACDQDHVMVIEFEIDDMTGEEIATASEILRDCDGVIDLVQFAGQGKKNRPVISFRLLAQTELADQVMDACFAQTSTIGLRHHVTERRILRRTEARDETGVRTKSVARPAGGASCKAEHDDLTGEDLHSRRRQKYQAELQAKRQAEQKG
ncbi:MAG: LarC family nickel insertion protein [Thalassospira sp.]|uniref:LarC family nickel insertion protein n=1 Tax=Thalassospira sp. TaxID=1912094 RepID=UPI0032EE3EA9